MKMVRCSGEWRIPLKSIGDRHASHGHREDFFPRQVINLMLDMLLD